MPWLKMELKCRLNTPPPGSSNTWDSVFFCQVMDTGTRWGDMGVERGSGEGGALGTDAPNCKEQKLSSLVGPRGPGFGSI